jgi:hypothetical protein
MKTLLRLMSRRLALLAILLPFAFQSSSQVLCETNDVLFVVATEMWGNEISWELVDEDGIAIALGGNYESNTAYTDNVCLDDGCYTVNMFDSFGDGWNGGLMTFILGDDVLGTGSLLEGSEGSFGFGVNTEGCDDNQIMPGCLDEGACNFDPDANFEDGSCTYPGCTDPEALNYDDTAGCDDDSCEYPQPCEANTVLMVMFDSFGDSWNGATYQVINSDGDVVAEGTHEEAASTSTDELCLEDGCYVIVTGGGSFDSENSYEVIYDGNVVASGYSPDINSFGINADGCEAVAGCTDTDACNYNEDALADDGSCTYPGCTDPEALNYDDEAGCDDESCEYPEPCDQNSVMMNMYDSFGDGWNGANYTITDGDGNVAAEGTLDEGSFEVEALCLADGCYTITTGGGAFDSENEWELVLGDEVIASGGSPSIDGFGLNADDCEFAFGCTDAEACNYNDTATTDDGSCVYPGCTDPSALNYDPTAGCDDGSCELCEDGVVALLYVCTWQNAEEIMIEILDDEGNPVIVLDDLPSVQISYFDICLEEGICYTVNMYNTVNDSWYNGYYWINVDGYQVSTGGLDDGETFGQEFFSIDGESCPVYGCTDPEALNYNADATEDDGSCEYPEPCDYNNVFVNLYDSFGDGWNGAYYSISNEDNVIVGEGTLEQGSAETHALCLADGCFNIYVEAGAFANEVSWDIMYDGNILLGGGAPDFGAFGINAECDEPIGGCTDETACNYNADAAWDDGSCTYPGCTDPEALNYDEYAGCDDDSCVYPEPCDYNTVMLNMYDSFGDGWNGGYYVITDGDGNVVAEGTMDTGSEETVALCLADGCYIMEVVAGNWPEEVEWTLSLGDEVITAGGAPALVPFGINADCEIIEGCTDADACNYNPDAVIDDESCTYPGCTDPEALNYDADAGCDDDSCEYPEPCDYNTVMLNMYDSFGDGWNGAYYSISNEDGVIVGEGTMEQGSEETHVLCLADGCYNIYVEAGAFANEVSWEIMHDGNILLTGVAPDFGAFGINAECAEPIGGCTDETACNYNADAAWDDGSCTFPGCTDPDALNYDADAGCDDDSCEYPEPCDYNTVMLNMYDSFGDGWNGGYYVITDGNGNVVAEGTMDTGSEETAALCLADGCYQINVEEGQWPDEVSWEITFNGAVLASGGAADSALFGINSDDCEIYGCTDPDALNYNPDATADDGSCEYIEDCDANQVQLYLSTSFYAWEISFELLDDEGNVILADGDYDNYGSTSYDLCLEDGCYTFNMYDSYGDGWNGGWYLFTGENGLLAEGSLFFGDASFDIISINSDCEIDGCMDEEALNYNPAATIDDGSCFYIDDFQITNPEEMLVPVMEVSLAPNPVDLEYKILLNNLDVENALNITIHDLSGRLIYQDIEAVAGSTMTIQMSSADLESGLYILTIVNGNNTSSVTFVRQN